MDSANRNNSNLVYKSISRKYNSNLFPFSFGLLIDFIRAANSELTGDSYFPITVTNRILHNNCKFKYDSTACIFTIMVIHLLKQKDISGNMKSHY